MMIATVLLVTKFFLAQLILNLSSARKKENKDFEMGHKLLIFLWVQKHMNLLIPIQNEGGGESPSDIFLVKVHINR